MNVTTKQDQRKLSNENAIKNDMEEHERILDEIIFLNQLPTPWYVINL